MKDELNKIIELNQQAYDKLAKEFEAKKLQRQPNDKMIIANFLNYTKKKPNMLNVLDLGPGNGNMSLLLTQAGCRVTAIELSKAMARVASSTAPDAKIVVGDFMRHHFTEQFDAILAIAFIHLFPGAYTGAILEKINGLLLPEGIAYIATTKHATSSEKYEGKNNFYDSIARFRRRFTPEELPILFEKHGFTILNYHEVVDKEESNKVWMNFVVSKPQNESVIVKLSPLLV